MTAPRFIDRRTFLAHLRESRLISPRQWAAVKDQLPVTNRGRPVARTLVALGLLTKFQAEQLLAGRTGGFRLGQYRILDQLGQGGMGRVFKARHRAMNRVVALKVLAPHLLKTDRAQELFLREVRAAAALAHPNIVTAYDANHHGGRYFLVLEYIDGPNLDQLVHGQGPLPVGQACDYVRQVAAGLHCAHQLGMVHRDIKPANVLVQRPRPGQGERYGVAKISDFGLARLHNPGPVLGDTAGTIMAKDNTVMGTPDFLSPEQARDLHKADIRSDLYSLGCTFYYLLTAQVPFPGGTTMEKLIRHSAEQPTPVERLRPEVPAAVAAVVRRLLAKAPDDRFQEPADLAAALAPFCRHGPTAPAAGPLLEPIFEEDDDLPFGSDPDVYVDSPEEESALNSTLPPALSPTPLSASRPPVTPPDADRRRRKIAFVVALGVVGGALALLTLLALLTR